MKYSAITLILFLTTFIGQLQGDTQFAVKDFKVAFCKYLKNDTVRYALDVFLEGNGGTPQIDAISVATPAGSEVASLDLTFDGKVWSFYDGDLTQSQIFEKYKDLGTYTFTVDLSDGTQALKTTSFTAMLLFPEMLPSVTSVARIQDDSFVTVHWTPSALIAGLEAPASADMGAEFILEIHSETADDISINTLTDPNITSFEIATDALLSDHIYVAEISYAYGIVDESINHMSAIKSTQGNVFAFEIMADGTIASSDLAVFDHFSDVITNPWLGLFEVGDSYTIYGYGDLAGDMFTWSIIGKETVLGVNCLLLRHYGVGASGRIEEETVTIAEDVDGNIRVFGYLTKLDGHVFNDFVETSSAAVILFPLNPIAGITYQFLNDTPRGVAVVDVELPQLSTGAGPYHQCYIYHWGIGFVSDHSFICPGFGVVKEVLNENAGYERRVDGETIPIDWHRSAVGITHTIQVGDTVTWTATDVDHTVSSTTPELLNPLDSGNISVGMTYSYTFNTAGTFNYICHHHNNMTGTVVVNLVPPIVTNSNVDPNTDLNIEPEEGADYALTVVGKKLPTTVVSGKRIKLSLKAKIQNVSNAPFKKGEVVDVLFYARNILTDTDLLIGHKENCTLSKLKVGKTKKCESKITLPKDIAAGTYKIVAQVDGTEAFVEDYTLTVEDRFVDIALVETKVVFPSVTIAGQKVNAAISVAVSNSGNITTPKTASLTFTVIARPTAGGDDIALSLSKSKVKFGKVKRTKKKKYLLKPQIPETVAEGTYDIFVWCDYGDIALEIDVQKKIHVSAPYINVAVEVGKVSIPTTVPLSQITKGEAQLLITNTGNISTSKKETITMTALARPVGDGDDIVIPLGKHVYALGNVKPGKTEKFNLKVSTGVDMPEGFYEIIVQSRFADAVSETTLLPEIGVKVVLSATAWDLETAVSFKIASFSEKLSRSGTVWFGPHASPFVPAMGILVIDEANTQLAGTYRLDRKGKMSVTFAPEPFEGIFIDWLGIILEHQGLDFNDITANIEETIMFSVKYKEGVSISGDVKIQSNMTAEIEGAAEDAVSTYTLKFKGTPIN